MRSTRSRTTSRAAIPASSSRRVRTVSRPRWPNLSVQDNGANPQSATGAVLAASTTTTTTVGDYSHSATTGKLALNWHLGDSQIVYGTISKVDGNTHIVDGRRNPNGFNNTTFLFPSYVAGSINGATPYGVQDVGVSPDFIPSYHTVARTSPTRCTSRVSPATTGSTVHRASGACASATSTSVTHRCAGRSARSGIPVLLNPRRGPVIAGSAGAFGPGPVAAAAAVSPPRGVGAPTPTPVTAVAPRRPCPARPRPPW